MSSQAEQTLTDALKEIGVYHLDCAVPSHRWLYASGTDEYLGEYDAAQSWAFVHEARAAA